MVGMATANRTVLFRRTMPGPGAPQPVVGTQTALPDLGLSPGLDPTREPPTMPPDWNGGNWSNLADVPARLDLPEAQERKVLAVLTGAGRGPEALRVAIVGLRGEHLAPDVLRKLMLRFAAYLGGGLLR